MELVENPVSKDTAARERAPTAFSAPTHQEQAAIELQRTSATEFACTFLARIGFVGQTLESYCKILRQHGAGISDLPILGYDGLNEIGITSPIDRTRILEATVGKVIRAGAPTVDGEPVEVRVKFGIANLWGIKTVDQTCSIKLFVDLYWTDPSMIGADPKHIPDYIWRPDGYIYNAIGGGEKCRSHDLILSDPAAGLLLCPLEFEVLLSNPMDLRAFPFDSDAVEMIFLQSEDSTADDWVLVPDDAPVDNCAKCFFDIAALGEFHLKGFSVDCYNQMGGNGIPYAHAALSLHLVREPDYYLWKIVLPIFLTTGICFSSMAFEIASLNDRINTSATMFLTTMALLFVVSTDLPKTTFLTKIDVYLNMSMLVQLAVLFEACVVSGALGGIGVAGTADEEHIDSWMLRLGGTGYVLCTLCFFVPRYLRYQKIANSTDETPIKLEPFDKGKGELPFYKFEVGKNVFF
jgi:hypothetical protein